MSDPVSMSLDDYIKTQKKTGRMSFGGRGGGRGGGGGRRGAKNNNPATPFRGGGGGGRGRGGQRGNNNRRGGGQNSFRGRQRQPQAANNVQRKRGNRADFRNKNRNQFAVFTGNAAAGGSVQGQSRRGVKNRNRNRQVGGRQRNFVGGTNQNRGLSLPQGTSGQRYFNTAALGGASLTTPRKRKQGRNVANQRIAVGLGNVGTLAAATNKATKRAFLKLAKKRVQRAKLLVSKKKPALSTGKAKKLIATSSGRLALGQNGFVTVRNTKAKRMERALVQMKIARAQQVRNRSPTQRNANLPSSSSGMGKRPARRPRPGPGPIPNSRQPVDWNPSPIVRTMRNEMVDEMTSSQLNPDIQRKIAFIQSRTKGDRAPVMPDFKAPVTTSRMKLSDRFRLLRDQ